MITSIRIARRKLRAVALAGFLAAAAGNAFAHDYKLGTLEIGHPWSRETPPGAKVGGGYLSVKNIGADADRLVAIESDIAGPIEIHQMAMDKGIMKMRQLTDGITVKPGETVKLAPGGYHVMFMNLKQPLKRGATIKAVLVFEKAGRIPVEFKVEAQGTSDPGMMNMNHGGQTQ